MTEQTDQNERTAIEGIYEILIESREDFANGYGGTKAAARRARKALQQVRELAKTARGELLAVMKDEVEPTSIRIDLK